MIYLEGTSTLMKEFSLVKINNLTSNLKDSIIHLIAINVEFNSKIDSSNLWKFANLCLKCLYFNRDFVV